MGDLLVRPFAVVVARVMIHREAKCDGFEFSAELLPHLIGGCPLAKVASCIARTITLGIRHDNRKDFRCGLTVWPHRRDFALQEHVGILLVGFQRGDLPVGELCTVFLAGEDQRDLLGGPLDIYVGKRVDRGIVAAVDDPECRCAGCGVDGARCSLLLWWCFHLGRWFLNRGELILDPSSKRLRP